MNGYETLDFVSRIVTLAANVIVAGVCFERFNVLRSRALLLLAISASLAVFSIFSELLLRRNPSDDSVYAFIWTGIIVLHIVDIILYAIGVTLLVKSIGRQNPGEQGGGGQAATRSESR